MQVITVIPTLYEQYNFWLARTHNSYLKKYIQPFEKISQRYKKQ